MKMSRLTTAISSQALGGHDGQKTIACAQSSALSEAGEKQPIEEAECSYLR